MEKVQRTAARTTCERWQNTSSVGDMLSDLGWSSLEARRIWIGSLCFSSSRFIVVLRVPSFLFD